MSLNYSMWLKKIPSLDGLEVMKQRHLGSDLQGIADVDEPSSSSHVPKASLPIRRFNNSGVHKLEP